MSPQLLSDIQSCIRSKFRIIIAKRTEVTRALSSAEPNRSVLNLLLKHSDVRNAGVGRVLFDACLERSCVSMYSSEQLR